MARQQAAKYAEWKGSFSQMGLVVLKTARSLLAVDWQRQFRCTSTNTRNERSERDKIEEKGHALLYDAAITFGAQIAAVISYTQTSYRRWHLNKLWNISPIIVNWWQHKNTLQHASTHQTLWSVAFSFLFFFFWKEDFCGASKHVFHALISALGRLGSRIWCSTFVWQFYLKDTVFSFPGAICHLKFHPYKPEALETLAGSVFEGTLTPHGWTALGEPDKVGV